MEPEASAELNIDELTYGQLLTHLANLGFEGEFEEVDEMKRELRRFKEEETAPFNPQEGDPDLEKMFENHFRIVKLLTDGIDEYLKIFEVLSEPHKNSLLPRVLKLKGMLNDLQNKIPSVMFVGDSSAGKSSLINLMLGFELMPVSPKPTTSTICEVRYSEKPRAIVKFRDELGDVVELDVDLSLEQTALQTLHKFVCVEGEERFTINKYQKVTVFWPSPILKHLILVDSPGFCDNELLTKVTSDFSKNAMGLILVVNSSRGAITFPVQEFLGNIDGKSNLHVNSLAICNKWGQIAPEEQESVSNSILSSIQRIWTKFAKDSLVTFDAQEASKFSKMFPKRICYPERKLRDKFRWMISQVLQSNRLVLWNHFKITIENTRKLVTKKIDAKTAEKMHQRRVENFDAHQKASDIYLVFKENQRIWETKCRDLSEKLCFELSSKIPTFKYDARSVFGTQTVSKRSLQSKIKERVNEAMQIWEGHYHHLETLQREIEETCKTMLRNAFKVSIENPGQEQPNLLQKIAKTVFSYPAAGIVRMVQHFTDNPNEILTYERAQAYINTELQEATMRSFATQYVEYTSGRAATVNEYDEQFQEQLALQLATIERECDTNEEAEEDRISREYPHLLHRLQNIHENEKSE